MNKWRVFSIGKTAICIHPSLFLYILYAIWTRHITFMLISLLSIFMHEAAHASIAALMGSVPSSLELSPLGAVMYLDEDKKQSGWKRAAMILAGPAATMVLCYFAVMLTESGGSSVVSGYMFFMANISILAVNLLPVLPLDGGRLLALILDVFLQPRYVTRILRITGTVVGLSLIVLNIYCSFRLGGWNLSLAFVGCCIWYCAYNSTTTQALREMRFFLDRKIKLEQMGWMPVFEICALSSTPIRYLLQKLPSRKYAVFLCMETQTMRPAGRMSENDLIQHYFVHPNATLGQCAAVACGKIGDK